MIFKKSKKLPGRFVVVVAVFTATSMSAQVTSEAPYRIAVVDDQAVLQSSLAGKQMLARMNKRISDFRAEDQRLRREVEQLELEAYHAKENRQEAAAAKSKAAMERDWQLIRWSAGQKQELSAEQTRETEALKIAAMQVIRQVMDTKGYAAVVPANHPGLLWIGREHDLTDEIIRHWNAEMRQAPKR